MTKLNNITKSSEWKNGGKELAGWLFLTILACVGLTAALLLTGGNR